MKIILKIGTVKKNKAGNALGEINCTLKGKLMNWKHRNKIFPQLSRGKISNFTRYVSDWEMARVAQLACNDVRENDGVYAFGDVLLRVSSPGTVARDSAAACWACSD